jgi:hypothetical protein
MFLGEIPFNPVLNGEAKQAVHAQRLEHEHTEHALSLGS